jgi:cytosine deaminase
MSDFLTLPKAGRLRLVNATVPGWLVGAGADLVRRDVCLAGDRIVADDGTGAVVDLRGAILFPAFIDMHTHLDKGHIWRRTPNPDGTFMGALNAVMGDSGTRWTAEDLRPRIEFGLRTAYAHGTRAIRTHLDTWMPQVEVTWPLFAEMRAEWAGRIELQGAALLGCDMVEGEGEFRRIADRVADHGGVLGLFTFPMPDLDARLRTFFPCRRDA